jgi:hypothetical protein
VAVVGFNHAEKKTQEPLRPVPAPGQSSIYVRTRRRGSGLERLLAW